MAILAGVDLLAKFYCNNDDVSEVGKRFRRFVQTFITHTHADPELDANAIYQLRNSLLHSFGLYSESRNRIYRFTVTQKVDTTLLANDNHDPERWIVNLSALQSRFEEAVEQYGVMLWAGKAPSSFSEALFEKYGWINIG